MPAQGLLSCIPLAAHGEDPNGFPTGWRVRFSAGEELVWKGFYTGPVTLSDTELAAIARQLLNIDLDEVPAAAARELTSYVSDGSVAPSLVIHSATPVLKSLQADLSDVRSGRTPDDVATYVETRSVSLASPGETVVGRTHTWQVAARLGGLDAVVIPGIEYYYLSHAILRLAASAAEPAQPLRHIAAVLRARPDTVVRLYSLDREIQMVLLYLKRLAGLEVLRTDANSPEVADYWNTKAPLHPAVNEADGIVVPADVYQALDAETELSALSRRIGLGFRRLPGYTVDGGRGSLSEVVGELRLAAHLLQTRYGVTVGCLKPSEGGGGARIRPGVALDDPDTLTRAAESLWHSQEQYVLEAQIHYAQTRVSGRNVPLAPSAHVRNGHVPDGVTLQLTNGTSWQGNVYVDRATCATLGIPTGSYDAMLAFMTEMKDRFFARGLSVVTAGVDFAMGYVGGRFNDDMLLAVQDPNMSAHGAEYLRLFRDQLGDDEECHYAATKVICPTSAGTLPALRATENAMSTPGAIFRAISAIPGRWGMIAAAAGTPTAAVENILAFEKDLIGRGLTAEAEPRR